MPLTLVPPSSCCRLERESLILVIKRTGEWGLLHRGRGTLPIATAPPDLPPIHAGAFPKGYQYHPFRLCTVLTGHRLRWKSGGRGVCVCLPTPSCGRGGQARSLSLAGAERQGDGMGDDKPRPGSRHQQPERLNNSPGSPQRGQYVQRGKGKTCWWRMEQRRPSLSQRRHHNRPSAFSGGRGRLCPLLLSPSWKEASSAPCCLLLG